MTKFAGIERKIAKGTKYFIYEDGRKLNGEIVSNAKNGHVLVLWSDGQETLENVTSILERIDAINKSDGTK